MDYHQPVLLEESIEALNIDPQGRYVDVTFGGGGHSREILQKLNDNGRLIAFDRDLDAKAQVNDDSKLIFIRSDFRYLKRFLDYDDLIPVDGILADLGVSSYQFDEMSRGFSFKDRNQMLDMRMNTAQEFSAKNVLNEYSENQLSHIFREYGELRNARRLASEIDKARGGSSLSTIGDLLQVVEKTVKSPTPKFLAQLFQAIRIEVNQEMQALEELLIASEQVLSPGGRLVVISYHSLEDRMVKRFMKTGNVSGEVNKDRFGNIFRPFRLVNKKTTTPSAEEIRQNPRARSAKLRIAEKL